MNQVMIKNTTFIYSAENVINENLDSMERLHAFHKGNHYKNSSCKIHHTQK